MSVSTSTSTTEPHAIEPQDLRRLSRLEFRKLAETGIFDDERVELLYGQIVVMSPTDPSHDTSVTTLTKLLIMALGDRATVRTQCSFAASDDSEPVPDLVVAPNQAYWHDHPAEALLLIEVARTSLRKDRGVKSRLYGSVEIREYWIVDVPRGCVEVLREPDGDGHWGWRRTAKRGEKISPEAFPDVEIAVDRIVPPLG